MPPSRDFTERRLRTPPVRALIVDDEGLSRERLRSLLERDERVEIVGECENGVEALHTIEAEGPDLVFLDVEMPELSGLAMLEALSPEQCPHVVFVTAHDKYLQRAFEVHALDFLRKPFTDERFFAALDYACRRVEEHLSHLKTHESIVALLSQLRDQKGLARDRVVVQEKGRGVFHIIRTRDIDWIQAKDGGVLIHVGKESYASRHTLKEMETRVEPGTFLRVHRSAIVNRSRILTVSTLWKGEYVLKLASGKSIGTGRAYRSAIEEFLACR
jgi:two-component system LytT family response regulator